MLPRLIRHNRISRQSSAAVCGSSKRPNIPHLRKQNPLTVINPTPLIPHQFINIGNLFQFFSYHPKQFFPLSTHIHPCHSEDSEAPALPLPALPYCQRYTPQPDTRVFAPLHSGPLSALRPSRSGSHPQHPIFPDIPPANGAACSTHPSADPPLNPCKTSFGIIIIQFLSTFFT